MLSQENFNKVAREYGNKVAIRLAKNSIGTIKAKSKLKKPMVINAKSQLSASKVYMAEYVFSNIKTDSVGDVMDQDMLCQNINGMKGDFEHTNLFNYEDFDDQVLFKVVDSHYDGTNLVGIVAYNTEHEQFPFVWEQTTEGNGGISIEYYEDFSGISGITWTIEPENEDCKLLAGYEVEQDGKNN